MAQMALQAALGPASSVRRSTVALAGSNPPSPFGRPLAPRLSLARSGPTRRTAYNLSTAEPEYASHADMRELVSHRCAVRSRLKPPFGDLPHPVLTLQPPFHAPRRTLRAPFRPPHYSIMLAPVLDPNGRTSDAARTFNRRAHYPPPSAALVCAWYKHPRPAYRRFCLPLGPSPLTRSKGRGGRLLHVHQ